MLSGIYFGPPSVDSARRTGGMGYLLDPIVQAVLRKKKGAASARSRGSCVFIAG